MNRQNISRHSVTLLSPCLVCSRAGDPALITVMGYSQWITTNTDYLSGINPNRYNYLLGVGMVWNLTTPLRVQQQVNAQKFISQALKDEYDLTDQRLKAQLVLADNKIKNALDNYREVPCR